MHDYGSGTYSARKKWASFRLSKPHPVTPAFLSRTTGSCFTNQSSRDLDMQKIRLGSLAFGLLLLGVSFLPAQNLASIAGTVTDPTGAVIPGVNVKLENPSTSVRYAAVTNAAGSYAIANVRPGPGYTITFDRDGFKALVLTGIYLNVDDTRTQNA